MGESIAEGTIVRWIKKVGDAVERDEPLFEISTDKVDAEIPAPAAGVLTEIRVHEGETVAVDSVVAIIGGPGDAPAAGGPALDAVVGADVVGAGPAAVSDGDADRRAGDDVADGRQRLSPLVRRLAREHNVDVSRIRGTGAGGRVTRQDVLAHLEGAGTGTAALRAGAPRAAVPADAEVKKLSIMRRKIAEHMVMSRRTSAHVHSVFHVDFSRVAEVRQARRAEFEQQGVKLTYMAFITQAVAAALRQFPIVNASLDGDDVVYRTHVNIGVAVALDDGLIVPVIRRADEMNLLGLSRAIADLAGRARGKQLSPDDVHDGTFTITNPGQFGAQFGMPIINQPQVAILGIGTIEKRPVVVDDGIVARSMCYLTLGYDHRLVDGATADQFMAAVKHHLEHAGA
jgi:2-oxoglutarate dehydrogenase E2 component (dihydrolipoamide succinyltransferase)